MYKLLEEELSRQDANQRHIVLHAGGPTRLKFGDESRSGSRIEDTVLPYSLWR